MKILGLYVVTIACIKTVHNCQQSTNQSVGGGDRFFHEQMRVISTSITKQMSSFK